MFKYIYTYKKFKIKTVDYVKDFRERKNGKGAILDQNNMLENIYFIHKIKYMPHAIFKWFNIPSAILISEDTKLELDVGVAWEEVAGDAGRSDPALDVIVKAGPNTCSTIEAASLSVLKDLMSDNTFDRISFEVIEKCRIIEMH